MTERQRVRLIVNGQERKEEIPSGMSLLDYLRDEATLFSVKTGCRVGYCGACTVLLDDLPVHSCCLLAVQVEGRRIETVEGDGLEVAACQNAFAANNAVQCGFCIPGMIMSGAAATRRHVSEEEVRDILLGNICRCGGYSRIFKAVMAANEGGAS